MAQQGSENLLVNLVYRVQNLASFASAVDQTLKASRALTAVNRDYGVEIQKTDARLNEARVRLSALQAAYQRSTTTLNTYRTQLAQAQAALARLDSAHGSHGALLNRITKLEQQRDAAIKRGAMGTAQAIQNLINQLQPIANVYGSLPAKILRFTEAMHKEETRHNSLSARIQTQIARIRELGAALADLTRKQSQAGKPAPGAAGEFWTKAANAVRLFGQAVGISTTATKHAQTAAKGLHTVLSKLPSVSALIQRAFQYMGTVLKYTLAILIADAVRTAIHTLRELGRTAFETVRDFERLSLSLRSLVAQELRAEDRTLGITQALRQAGPIAARTIKWLEQLAIISPFSLADIKQAYLFGQAMGFTTSQAQRVTQAVVDWASATGRTGEQIERVIYALGQIRTAGRLVGQDILQLAQAGIGVDEILARAFNKTTAEIREMRIAGLIPAQQALEIIIKTLEQDWAGAAKEQARSLAGLTSAFQDVGSFLLRDLLGPIESTSAKAGGALGVLTEHLGELVDFLQSDPVRRTIKKWGEGLEQLTKNAFVWGKNLVTSFANGMLSSVINVINALSSIGRWIAYYLEAHSPPRLLPDIDEWGRSALQAYLSGFNDLRQNAFSDLERNMERFIRSLTEDVIGEIDVVPTILNIREALAQALSGDFSISEIVGSLGLAGESMSNYVGSLLEYLQATELAKQAQAELDSITAHYDKLLGDLEDQIRSVTNAQQDLLDDQRIRMLELVLQDPNATANEKRLAQLEIERIMLEGNKRVVEEQADAAIDEAKEKLDAAKAEQEAAEARYELQKLILDSQIHTNELIREQLALLERLNKAAAEKAGAGETSLLDTSEFSGLFDLIDERMKDIEKLFFGGKESPRPTPLQLALQRLREVWDQVWARIQSTLQPVTDALGRLQEKWNSLVASVIEKIPELQELWGKFVAELIKLWGEEGPKLIDQVGSVLTELEKLWDEHGISAIGLVLNFTLVIVGLFIGLMKFILATLTLTLKVINAAWSVATTLLTTDWRKAWDDIKSKVYMTTALVILRVMEWVSDLWTTITTKLGEIKSKWDEIWLRLKEKVDEKIAEVKTTISTKIEEIKTAISAEVDKFKTLGEDLINGIKEGVVAAALGLAGAVIQAIRDALEAAKDFLQPGSPSKLTAKILGKPMGQGIAMGIAQSMPDVEAAMTGLTHRAVFPVSANYPAGGGGVSRSTTNNYNYAPHYNGAPSSPQRDFAIMRVWSK